ncbi:MAG: FBP domain-containing protein, partial [Clostridium sp.]
PEFDFKEKKTVYLGWFDESTRKLLISYNMNGKLVGMVCRLQGFNSTKTHICALCNRMGKDDEITYVSSLCKTTSKSLDAYKSTAFYVCLDSEKCNEKITSTDKLEEILKDVNNIK